MIGRAASTLACLLLLAGPVGAQNEPTLDGLAQPYTLRNVCTAMSCFPVATFDRCNLTEVLASSREWLQRIDPATKRPSDREAYTNAYGRWKRAVEACP